MSGENEEVMNRRTLVLALEIERHFKTSELDENEGSLFLHAMVATVLGSLLCMGDEERTVRGTSASPELVHDGWEVLAAARTIVKGNDADCICALLQATLTAMRPAVLGAVAASFAESKRAN